MFPQKERTPEEANALIRELAWNDAFGCYTKNGFKKLVWPKIAKDARWIIFFDVNGVHEINQATHGYAVFDAMMKQVLAILRHTDYVAGQLNSGDEFLVCLTDRQSEQTGDMREQINPQAMMQRLIEALKQQGLTATFAVVPVVSQDLDITLEPAIEQVLAAQNARGWRSR